MLQRNSDFLFGRPMIYFGAFDQIRDDDEREEIKPSIILDIDPKHPLGQGIGLYFLWPDS